jgi:hypothetical protein
MIFYKIPVRQLVTYNYTGSLKTQASIKYLIHRQRFNNNFNTVILVIKMNGS